MEVVPEQVNEPYIVMILASLSEASAREELEFFLVVFFSGPFLCKRLAPNSQVPSPAHQQR